MCRRRRQLWYVDSGANQHITADLENLNLSQEPYQGSVVVTEGNGSSLPIANTGSTTLTAQNSTFQLKTVLRCPYVPLTCYPYKNFVQKMIASLY